MLKTEMDLIFSILTRPVVNLIFFKGYLTYLRMLFFFFVLFCFFYFFVVVANFEFLFAFLSRIPSKSEQAITFTLKTDEL